MTLVEVARIPLPDHAPGGGFDHSAVDHQTDRLYVAHTANDAVDVVDLGVRRYLRSLPGLEGVAGAWVNEDRRFLFTSNRGEDTASVFRIGDEGEEELFRVPTGVRPNGMAFDERRGIWLIAGVGNPKAPDAPPTLTFVRVDDGTQQAQLRAPGRTRWATYHAGTDAFYVNVADPPSIVSVRANDLTRIARTFPIPAIGPHGMEQDPGGELLYCAADEGGLFALNVLTGGVTHVGPIEGSPDVLWMDGGLRHLYAAADDPASVQLFRTESAQPVESFPTAEGAHTLTVDSKRHEIHVFLPESHEDLVLADRSD